DRVVVGDRRVCNCQGAVGEYVDAATLGARVVPRDSAVSQHEGSAREHGNAASLRARTAGESQVAQAHRGGSDAVRCANRQDRTPPTAIDYRCASISTLQRQTLAQNDDVLEVMTLADQNRVARGRGIDRALDRGVWAADRTNRPVCGRYC